MKRTPLIFLALLLLATGCGMPARGDGSVQLSVVKGEYRAQWQDNYQYDTPILIDKFADWQKFLKDHPAQSTTEDVLKQEYKESFFKEHLLYVYIKGEPSGSNTLTVKGATRQEDTLKLGMERVVPEQGTDDLASRICIFGLKREDVKNVKAVEGVISEVK
jgi:hypothetical protein